MMDNIKYNNLLGLFGLGLGHDFGYNIIWLLTLDIEQPSPTLVVENISLERIESHKVLGLTIQNNLKWDLHISEIVTKASKRLHILRVLKRN